jgi:phage host-nuclease inhibitor protein Gam
MADEIVRSEIDVLDYVDEENPEVRGPWKIQNLTSVDWALRRLGECEAEVSAIKAQAAAAIAAIDHRAGVLIQKAQGGAAFFGFKILQWAEHHPEEIHRGKTKHRAFIHGRVGTKKKGGLLKVTDKEALVTWLRSQDPGLGFWRVKIEPEMKDLQDEYKKNGVVPPGMEVEEERDEIYVEAELPKE